MNVTGNYHPIDCELHDYLEIACLYHYWLRIELTDGSCMNATALTTCTTRDKEEFLVVEYNGNPLKIRLDRLSAIAALTAGATFSVVSFR